MLAEIFMVQKINEALYKKLNLINGNGIDEDAMLKFADKNVTDASWKAVMKIVIETCYKNVDSKKNKILKELAEPPFNISFVQCNGLFMTMTTCVQLKGFVVKKIYSNYFLVFCKIINGTELPERFLGQRKTMQGCKILDQEMW